MLGDDARLRSLMRSAYRRGRNMRAYDHMRGVEPPVGAREVGFCRELGFCTAVTTESNTIFASDRHRLLVVWSSC